MSVAVKQMRSRVKADHGGIKKKRNKKDRDCNKDLRTRKWNPEQGQILVMQFLSVTTCGKVLKHINTLPTLPHNHWLQ